MNLSISSFSDSFFYQDLREFIENCFIMMYQWYKLGWIFLFGTSKFDNLLLFNFSIKKNTFASAPEGRFPLEKYEFFANRAYICEILIEF